jgi:hypothetical protein
MASHDSWMNALRCISDVLEEAGEDASDDAENFIDFCRAIGRRDPNAMTAARGFAQAVDDEMFELRTDERKIDGNQAGTIQEDRGRSDH